MNKYNKECQLLYESLFLTDVLPVSFINENKSSSTVLIPATPNLSIITFATSGDKKQVMLDRDVYFLPLMIIMREKL